MDNIKQIYQNHIRLHLQNSTHLLEDLRQPSCLKLQLLYIQARDVHQIVGINVQRRRVMG